MNTTGAIPSQAQFLPIPKIMAWKSPDQMARLFGIGTTRARKMMGRGFFPNATQTGNARGPNWRIPLTDIYQWIEDHRHPKSPREVRGRLIWPEYRSYRIREIAPLMGMTTGGLLQLMLRGHIPGIFKVSSHTNKAGHNIWYWVIPDTALIEMARENYWQDWKSGAPA